MIKNNIIPDVNPGDIVGDSPTFPTNAKVVGDELYLRDEEGNIIHGRSTDDGDEITVLDISYGSQLALIQYPTGSGYRQGYVTNATNIIKYNDNYSWVNGSTEEAVYDLDKETQIGTLDPRERAVILYKVDGMTAVAYDTGKGKLTKSGLVYYEGSGAGGGSTGSGVRPGDIVKDGFTYENNAQVVGDELYLRDENGNIIHGRSVSDGDNITVLDVGYTKQLALVQYPAGDVVRQGYVTNATNLIKYFNQYSWHNGSTEEEVFDENGGHLGSLNPYESATPLYKKNGMTHVVYDTIKGPNTKSGYVKYEGASSTRVDIPYPSVTNAEKIVYGTSGKGRELAAYRIGNGENSLVFVCAIHGWEDNWPADGVELTKIGNGLIEHFQNNKPSNWSLYIIPAANPDGISEGFTNNGPGRCTIVGAVDCNRDFPLGFSPGGVPRYHSGSEPLSVSESKGLHDFIQDIKNGTSGEMCVIDLHGWEGAAIGNTEIGQYFRNEFGFEQRYGYGDNRGFMIGWAKSIGAKAALIELPGSTRSHSDVVNGRYLQKIINAVTNLIGNSGGSSTGGDIGSDETYITTGEVINVQTFLNVRKGPGTNYDSVGKLHQGDEVSIEAKNGDWYKISSPIAGYVHKDFIKIKSGGKDPIVGVQEKKVIDAFNESILAKKLGLVYKSIGSEVSLFKNELLEIKAAIQNEMDVTKKSSSIQFINGEIAGFQVTGGSSNEKFLKDVTFEFGVGKDINFDIQTILEVAKTKVGDTDEVKLEFDFEYKKESGIDKGVVTLEVQDYYFDYKSDRTDSEISYAYNGLLIFEFNISYIEKCFEEIAYSVEELIDVIKRDFNELTEHPAILVAVGCLAAVLVVLALPEEVVAVIAIGFMSIVADVVTWFSNLFGGAELVGYKIIESYIATFINSVLGVGKEFFA